MSKYIAVSTVFGTTTARRLSRQERTLLDLLERDGHVTRLTAMHAGIANVTARIAELRLDADVKIKAEVRKDIHGRRYARWSLAAPVQYA